MEKTLKVIKEEVEKKGFNVLKIILFGSRAIGKAREDSDWDFFVIIDKKLNFNENGILLMR